MLKPLVSHIFHLLANAMDQTPNPKQTNSEVEGQVHLDITTEIQSFYMGSRTVIELNRNKSKPTKAKLVARR